MKKDIDLPEVKDVGIAIIPESENGITHWFVYIINFRSDDISHVIIASSGYGVIDGRKKETTVLRYHLDHLEAGSYRKLEYILEDAFQLTNQFWVSFYEGSTLFDKKFIFVPESIHELNLVMIPVVEQRGVIIR